MPQYSAVLAASLAYLGLLFAIASLGDRFAARWSGGPRPAIYALSLGVYCTSWTFFGSVGIAARSGFDFLPIYIGPILMFALGWPLLQTIAAIAKRQNIASIADFISARYGKSEALGALVAGLAVIGIVPYISIQLKAVAVALAAMVSGPLWPAGIAQPDAHASDLLSALAAVTMGAFAILFGTRHIDTTEHQHGMILAIAVESVVKLVAFVAVGLFVVYGMMGGFVSFAARASATPEVTGLFTHGLDGGRWITMTLLAACAIVLLPRQFHVAVVENASRADIHSAARLFPAYLIAINLFVVPIAIAGLLLLPPGSDGDSFVLALPLAAGSKLFAMVAFIGGLSASSAMVIVESIALSIMVCNNLVVPVLLRRHDERADVHANLGRRLIAIRRAAIVVVLTLAYLYYRMIGSSAALAQVGLISFAAVAQLAPAFFGGLVWTRGTARGAVAGICAGFLLWAWCLLLPSFADAGWIGQSLIDNGPLGIGFLRPRMLFNMAFDPLTHGVLWSLAFNIAAYVGVSLARAPDAAEAAQAQRFLENNLKPGGGTGLRLWRSAISVERLEETVARYVGQARARAAFADFFAGRGGAHDGKAEADIHLVRFAEHLLASAVGVASARLVVALLLERNSAQPRGALKLLDEASAAIQHNRDLLQTAIENAGQGIAVFDADLALICWNSQFQHDLDLLDELIRVGTPLPEIAADFLSRCESESSAGDRARQMADAQGSFRERLRGSGKVIEVRSNAIPEGGLVVTFADVSDSVAAAEALLRANESLERRVEERTAELTRLNDALADAKAEAEAANIGKTRFIASASHDILQPLNAARLFTSSLAERLQRPREAELVRNVDASLEAVEEILAALLDISRLDAGAMKPEIAAFRIDELLQALALEFGPAARRKGLSLKVMPCRLTVETDRKLLRRILQNLVSNAVKYTRRGRVLMGCRWVGDKLRIEVHDTGPGIPDAQRDAIFQEFHRIDTGHDAPSGLGLGLAIVERIARVLDAPVDLRSKMGAGSVFAVTVPAAREAAARTVAATRKPHRLGLGGTMSVLVIDNEMAILDGMESLLTGWGCQVSRAMNAKQAEAALAASPRPIDMVLADYHLGTGDGIAVVELLRRRARRHIPAVLITADRSTRVADEATAHDIHLLRKPVKPAALRAAMAHAATRTETVE